MRLLLDSHTLFWAISEDQKLSGTARRLMLDEDNDVFYSPVNLYKITFKAHRGRMAVAAMHVPEAALTSGFKELALMSLHLVHAARLDWSHGDPWDRILLAQATLEDLYLVSVDEAFDARTHRRLW
jgi:PIN domain nuclease of toxin-antitoxin system